MISKILGKKKPKPKASEATYDEVRSLSDWAHVRLRTEKEFGSRETVTESIVGFRDGELALREHSFVPALSTYFREILDNALDEVLGHGYGDSIWVTYDESTMTFSVKDNGRGVPAEHVATVFGQARAGRNFGEREEVIGTNGVGAACTNFTSEFFEVQTWHGGVHHTQRWEEDPSKDAEDSIIHKPVQGKCPKTEHGTLVTFKPSKLVYPTLLLPEEFVRERINELAATEPLLKVHYNGSRVKFSPKLAKSLFAGKPLIEINIKGVVEGKTSDVRVVGGGSSKAGKITTDFFVVPAFSQGTSEVVHSIVNRVCAYQGGSHVAAFKSVFTRGMLGALSTEARRRKLHPNKADLLGGLLIFNVTTMPRPDFDSQSKTRLINPEAKKAVETGMDESVFRAIVKQNPEWIEDIFKRCSSRTNKQDMSEAEKLSKKNAKAKVAKLSDASGKDRSKCILFIGEGDSALGLLRSERDPKIHGVLPLKGKIMNVNGVSPAKVIKSEALADIMNALGLQLGKSALPGTLRYGKVYIATDEDEDGKNINALIVNFLYTFWPEIFDPDNPTVFRFETPFIVLIRGKQRKYFHGREYSNFHPEDWKGWEVVRAKGLSSLEKPDWRHALDQPSLVPITDDGMLSETLDLIFNKDRADDRKVWLGQHES